MNLARGIFLLLSSLLGKRTGDGLSQKRPVKEEIDLSLQFEAEPASTARVKYRTLSKNALKSGKKSTPKIARPYRCEKIQWHQKAPPSSCAPLFFLLLFLTSFLSDWCKDG